MSHFFRSFSRIGTISSRRVCGRSANGRHPLQDPSVSQARLMSFRYDPYTDCSKYNLEGKARADYGKMFRIPYAAETILTKDFPKGLDILREHYEEFTFGPLSSEDQEKLKTCGKIFDLFLDKIEAHEQPRIAAKGLDQFLWVSSGKNQSRAFNDQDACERLFNYLEDHISRHGRKYLNERYRNRDFVALREIFIQQHSC